MTQSLALSKYDRLLRLPWYSSYVPLCFFEYLDLVEIRFLAGLVCF